MTPDEEAFVHLAECLTSLNNAWRILKELRSTDVPQIARAAAYRMALVEYAKPYKASRGTVKRSHALCLPELAEPDRKLHARIIALRDQVLAHSDISIKEARLHLKEIHGRTVTVIVQSMTESFPEMEEVLGLIERSLDKLYVTQRELEQRLGPAEP